VTSRYLVYGANGYTGQLVARLAASRGECPVLAGRAAGEIERIAKELGFPRRVFSLDDPNAVDRGLEGTAVVLHCAGPFSRTYRAMAEACLRTKTHYLHVTGEAVVFEALAARDAEARKAGIMLLPGSGFDVVPSDCLALHLKNRLPTAKHLSLGFQPIGSLSRGTATTMTENLHRGGLVRRGGRLVSVPAAWKTRVIDFGRGPRKAMTIPWGDVATAWYSTGIPDIEVFMAAPTRVRVATRLSRYVAPLLATKWVQDRAKARIRSGPPGPTDEQRARGRSLLWGEASDDAGKRVVSRLEGPEGYTLTAHAALAIVGKVLGGDAPVGYQTPAKAYGADFVLGLEGVTRTDEL
jgi:short subunit dehydrogenase-like uncharacterized protein